MAPALNEVGIVSLNQAIQDNVPGVLHETTLCEQRDIDINNMYWCTLCSACMSGRTAYRHRTRHVKEVDTDSRADAWDHLHRTLDELYGVYVLNALIETRPYRFHPLTEPITSANVSKQH
jgi:hypothetical protein